MVTMITGATDGIGLALARAYQQKGDRLVLVGRRSFESLGDVFDSDNYCRMDLSEYSEISNISSFLQTHRITEIDRLILLAHAPIDNPGGLKGRKLFIVSEGDGLVSSVRSQHKAAPDPKKLIVLPGNAHAQHIFKTPQGDALMREMIAWLTG